MRAGGGIMHLQARFRGIGGAFTRYNKKRPKDDPDEKGIVTSRPDRFFKPVRSTGLWLT